MRRVVALAAAAVLAFTFAPGAHSADTGGSTDSGGGSGGAEPGTGGEDDRPKRPDTPPPIECSPWKDLVYGDPGTFTFNLVGIGEVVKTPEEVGKGWEFAWTPFGGGSGKEMSTLTAVQVCYDLDWLTDDPYDFEVRADPSYRWSHSNGISSNCSNPGSGMTNGVYARFGLCRCIATGESIALGPLNPPGDRPGTTAAAFTVDSVREYLRNPTGALTDGDFLKTSDFSTQWYMNGKSSNWMSDSQAIRDCYQGPEKVSVQWSGPLIHPGRYPVYTKFVGKPIAFYNVSTGAGADRRRSRYGHSLPSSGAYAPFGVPSAWETWVEDDRKFVVTTTCGANPAESEVSSWPDGGDPRYYDAATCPGSSTPAVGEPGGGGSIPSASFEWSCEVAKDFPTLEHPDAAVPMYAVPGEPIEVVARNDAAVGIDWHPEDYTWTVSQQPKGVWGYSHEWLPGGYSPSPDTLSPSGIWTFEERNLLQTMNDHEGWSAQPYQIVPFEMVDAVRAQPQKSWEYVRWIHDTTDAGAFKSGVGVVLHEPSRAARTWDIGGVYRKSGVFELTLPVSTGSYADPQTGESVPGSTKATRTVDVVLTMPCYTPTISLHAKDVSAAAAR